MPNNTQPTTHDAEANYLGNDIAEKQGGDVEFLRKRLLEYQLKIKTQDQLLEAFRTSTSWRITAPLRFVGKRMARIIRLTKLTSSAIRQAGGLKQAFHKAMILCRHEGVFGGARKIISRMKRQPSNDVVFTMLPPVIRPASELLTQRILIIAELSISQCTKYRVTQKQRLFTELGIDCTIISWTELDHCLSALATHSTVIFYRVPGYPGVLRMISEAKRMKMKLFWEVDDVVFDREIIKTNQNLKTIDKKIIDGILNGAELYRNAMIACGAGIASTTGLAEAMSSAGLKDIHIIENALDSETIRIAEPLFIHRKIKKETEIIRIIYGSGTDTHNIDFEQASQSLFKIMLRFKHVHLRIAGPIDLPDNFNQLKARIERLPFCSYDEYLKHLSECDINIAPLEPSLFNDAKSNIKYLEAAALGIPSVCSPRSAFSKAIQNGVNGYLADTPEQWDEYLTQLITDNTLRQTIGLAAHEAVYHQYHPLRIAQQQLLPLIALDARPQKTRVLAVNVFYNPRSFGGATIVAEQVNKILAKTEDCEVFVFTTLPESAGKPGSLRRYEVDGVTIFGVVLPAPIGAQMDFENPSISNIFCEVIKAVDPDIVHLHSIQTIGVNIAEECLKLKIPYVITLHDAWWICAKQFMVNKKGKYCNQKKIDLRICEPCVNSKKENQYRQNRLRSVLEHADMLLSPSQFFADLYIANDFNPEKVFVNKNGILRPNLDVKRSLSKRLRFGYVGGNGAIKGLDLIKETFASLAREDIELVIVDNTINLGFSAFPPDSFKNIPNVFIVPAYTQKTADEFFSNIDVLLFPTQWKESFGLTVREAIARHVWVIATDAGGVVEDIRQGENGFIIPFEDQGSGLYEAILQTIEYFKKPTAVNSLMNSSNKIRFFDEQASELLGVYKNVLSSQEKNKATSE